MPGGTNLQQLPAYNLGIMQNQGFDGELTFRDHVGQLSYLSLIHIFLILKPERNLGIKLLKRLVLRM